MGYPCKLINLGLAASSLFSHYFLYHSNNSFKAGARLNCYTPLENNVVAFLVLGSSGEQMVDFQSKSPRLRRRIGWVQSSGQGDTLVVYCHVLISVME